MGAQAEVQVELLQPLPFVKADQVEFALGPQALEVAQVSDAVQMASMALLVTPAAAAAVAVETETMEPTSSEVPVGRAVSPQEAEEAEPLSEIHQLPESVAQAAQAARAWLSSPVGKE